MGVPGDARRVGGRSFHWAHFNNNLINNTNNILLFGVF